jgi:hypothetical protein
MLYTKNKVVNNNFIHNELICQQCWDTHRTTHISEH